MNDKGQPLIFTPLRRPDKAGVFGAGEFFPLVAEGGLLDLQQLHRQIPPAQKGEKAVDGSQHGVEGGRGVAGGQVLFPLDQRRLGDGCSVKILQQGGEVVDVLLHSGQGPLQFP